MVGLTWTSGYSIVFYAATAVLTIGGALALLTETGRKALAWFRPAHPLISFGHPEESPFPFVIGLGGSEADMDRQFREKEELRLKSLSVDYLIENKGTTNADTVRELSTGIRSIDGVESHTFESCFVQILGPGRESGRLRHGGSLGDARRHDGREPRRRLYVLGALPRCQEPPLGSQPTTRGRGSWTTADSDLRRYRRYRIRDKGGRSVPSARPNPLKQDASGHYRTVPPTRQAGGHWFEPSTAHLTKALLTRGFSSRLHPV